MWSPTSRVWETLKCGLRAHTPKPTLPLYLFVAVNTLPLPLLLSLRFIRSIVYTALICSSASASASGVLREEWVGLYNVGGNGFPHTSIASTLLFRSFSSFKITAFIMIITKRITDRRLGDWHVLVRMRDWVVFTILVMLLHLSTCEDWGVQLPGWWQRNDKLNAIQQDASVGEQHKH